MDRHVGAIVVAIAVSGFWCYSCYRIEESSFWICSIPSDSIFSKILGVILFCFFFFFYSKWDSAPHSWRILRNSFVISDGDISVSVSVFLWFGV